MGFRGGLFAAMHYLVASQVLLGLELVTPEQAWSGVAASLFGLGLGVSGLKIKRDWKIGGAACLAMAIILTGFIY